MSFKSTLMEIVPDLYPSLEAVIVVLPTPTDVTKPFASTVATSGFLDSQVTPSTDAVNWTVSPKISVFLSSLAVIVFFLLYQGLLG